MRQNVCHASSNHTLQPSLPSTLLRGLRQTHRKPNHIAEEGGWKNKMEVNEGELKKRIIKAGHYKNSAALAEDTVTDLGIVSSWIDEAKKDFPINDCSDFDYVGKINNWFEKWFGDK